MRDLAPEVLLARYGRGGPSDELVEEARGGVADRHGPECNAQAPPSPFFPVRSPRQGATSHRSRSRGCTTCRESIEQLVIRGI